MPDFSSHYNATIDDKGRVVLPSAYKRDMIEDADRIVYVEKDPYEACLNIYPLSSWSGRISLIKSRLNPNDPEHNSLLDKFYQNFVKINMAENGRLNVPNSFYEWAGIVKEVVFSGQGDRVRLWNAETYRGVIMPDEKYSQLFRNILGGNINH
ncbi:MAG: hypothetical protein K9H26_07335 [Prolixibacteraceae bacterium]|nr:hypothetical protein [Prolixibacteraceae bacterium]